MKVRAPLHSIDVRGRFGVALVFSIWRGANYARTFTIPTNPRTARQLTIRAFLTTASRAWNALTNAQRTAWDAFAQLQSRTDVFGEPIKATGINEYVALSVIAQDVGQVPVSDPPITDAPAVLAGAAADPNLVPGEIEFAWTGADGDFVDCWVTSLLPAGRKPSENLYTHAIYPAIGASPATVTGKVSGGKYGVKVRAVRNNGQIGPFQSFIVIPL